MSLVRFLTDTATILRPGSSQGATIYLPSGEVGQVDTNVAGGISVACRIRDATRPSFTDRGPQPLAVGDLEALFAPDVPALPRPGDHLVRDLDGQIFEVVSQPRFRGDRGHAMAHYQVALKEVG